MSLGMKLSAVLFTVVFGACIARSAVAEEAGLRGLTRFAEVNFTGGRGSSQESITLFDVTNSPGRVWARRISSRNRGPEWASSETCDAVLDAVRELAEISEPAFFLRVPQEGPTDEVIVVTADGPRVIFWARGWFRAGYLHPGEIELRGGSELPQSAWLVRTNDRLAGCWSPNGPD